ncbi:serine O-acetyltransferase [Microbacterium sp. SMR1]|uniref:serine O-acetyltransferase n=1 Tax=Microbacterium sp. SMR1 TaxID=1497340 RepID=UPI001C682AA4|nr:DapH/DapD/GlmU-related protein [Microbacterium sp. SMR1]
MSEPRFSPTSARPRSLVTFIFQDQCETGAPPSSLLKALVRSVFSVRHTAVTLFRLAQAIGPCAPPLASLLKQFNHVVTGADLAWRCKVGPGLVLHHPTGVVWGPGIILGARCRVQQGVTIGGKGGSDEDGSPRIGANVILGAGSRVLGAIEIGDDCIVGANAVVLSDVPSGRTAVGIPARVLNPRASEGV